MVTTKDAFKKYTNITDAMQILAIPEDEPERFFLYPDEQHIKTAFRLLAKKWHPDRNKDPKASDVFNRVRQLKKNADLKIESGSWQKPGELFLTPISGNSVKITFLKKHNFELGEFYISNNFVTYLVRKEFSDLFKNAVKTIGNLKFANDDMREKTEEAIPTIHKVLETNSHYVLTVRKTPDSVLARDLLDHCNEKIDPRHVAWMTSRFHNLGCYLQWSNLTHNALSLDTCFISPKQHSVSLLGGWWYAAPENKKLLGLPAQTLDSVPRAVLESGIADKRVDMMLLRVLAKELLGDKTGVRLSRDKTIPEPMSNWVCLPGSGDAFQDYKTWMEKIVIESFGPRRFQNFDVSPREIYQPLTKGD